jgi:hypothetical protein
MNGGYRLLARALAGVGAVVLLVLFVRIVLDGLTALLSPAAMRVLREGVGVVGQQAAPILPAAAAVGLLWAVWWLLAGRRG